MQEKRKKWGSHLRYDFRRWVWSKHTHYTHSIAWTRFFDRIYFKFQMSSTCLHFNPISPLCLLSVSPVCVVCFFSVLDLIMNRLQRREGQRIFSGTSGFLRASLQQSFKAFWLLAASPAQLYPQKKSRLPRGSRALCYTVISRSLYLCVGTALLLQHSVHGVQMFTSCTFEQNLISCNLL